MIKILITVAIGTYLTRAFPFLYFKNKDISDKFIKVIDALPYATISLLVVYSFKDVNRSSLLPTILASTLCCGTYLWKRNTVLSILASTVLYMILI
ncbi:MAG TPA: AzlD domain-containing protein [Erysipelothrix sp.]|nr:AzlD domain-containing protein [Erysipelothrix sp.]